MKCMQTTARDFLQFLLQALDDNFYQEVQVQIAQEFGLYIGSRTNYDGVRESGNEYCQFG